MNMSLTDIRTNIIKHIKDNYSETPVEYPPNPFDEDSFNEWISVHIDMGSSFTVMKGVGTVTRHTGLIHVAIHVKRKRDGKLRVGTQRIYELADIVLALLERTRLNDSNVTTRAGYVDTAKLIDPESDEIGFGIVTIPFVVT